MLFRKTKFTIISTKPKEIIFHCAALDKHAVAWAEKRRERVKATKK